MRSGSVLSHYQLYFSAGVLAAQSNFGDRGFRQRDVRFYIELFSNWMDATLPATSLEIHNVQIARYLEDLAEQGLAKRSRQQSVLTYRLTRPGIIELLSQMVKREQFLPLEQFFFLHYAVENYGRRIAALAESEGSQFPHALRLELDVLRDPRHLRKRQLQYVELEIAKLDARIRDGIAATELARCMFEAGATTAQVVAEIQKRFPYELNNQKPMVDLFQEIPETMRRLELEQGLHDRARKLFTPMRAHLNSYREVLLTLSSQDTNIDRRT